MRFLSTTRAVACLIGALAMVAPYAAGASAAPVAPQSPIAARFAVTSADACLDSDEVQFLSLINDFRGASGVRPLAVSASLSAAAAYHSIDMAEQGYLAHTLVDGTSVEQNMANFGYQGGTFGENIAAGTDTASAAMQTWQGSGEHTANMLNGEFGAIGIGRAYDPASQYGWYWTTIFGDVNDGPGWVCGEAAPPSKSLSLFQSVDTALTGSDVNLRTGPGSDYPVVSTLPADTAMTVTGREQSAYLPVKVDGQYGWVAADYVAQGAVSLPQTAAAQPSTATALSPVGLRGAPSSDAAVVQTIPAVAVVTLTGQAQDGFLEVEYNGQVGWADAAFLEVAPAPASTELLQTADATTGDQAKTGELAPAQSTLDASPGAEAVATANVNLRAQPSPDAVVLSVVPSGSIVSLTGSRANGYLNVRVAGQAGWIDEAYLQ
jgi:uncharacterized protein YkwD/uncharacterized protein YraI